MYLIFFREYDVKKAFELNKFVDQSIIAMRKRLFEIKCANVKIPNFQIFTINGMVNNILILVITKHRYFLLCIL